jgi:hypothetical protein
VIFHSYVSLPEANLRIVLGSSAGNSDF